MHSSQKKKKKTLNALNTNTFSKPLWSTRFFFFSKFNAAVRYSAHYYLTMAAASPSGYGGYCVALFPLQQSAVPDHAKPSVCCLDCGCMEIPATSLVATLQAFSVWWLNIFYCYSCYPYAWTNWRNILNKILEKQKKKTQKIAKNV